MEADATKQRQEFYRDYAGGEWSMSELCDRYGISRPTGYKWVQRIEHEGTCAVPDRSRAPVRHPNQTPEHDEYSEATLEVHRGATLIANHGNGAMKSPSDRHLAPRSCTMRVNIVRRCLR